MGDSLTYGKICNDVPLSAPWCVPNEGAVGLFDETPRFGRPVLSSDNRRDCRVECFPSPVCPCVSEHGQRVCDLHTSWPPLHPARLGSFQSVLRTIKSPLACGFET